ncbi:hypothetical protein [Phoenicibacter congonensis]|uniref:hypothetical protein n=1 Tax=Phoenicibacter congonensis TaxID=1944646 RepID=UPI0009A80161|nr:hypothetical protein [Phoenicibacter congonensis]
MAIGRQNRQKTLLHKRNAAVTNIPKAIQHMRETLWQMALGRQNRKKALLHKRNAAVTNIPKEIQHMREIYYGKWLSADKKDKNAAAYANRCSHQHF